jgi:hypothetical protein
MILDMLNIYSNLKTVQMIESARTFIFLQTHMHAWAMDFVSHGQDEIRHESIST